MSSTHQTAWPVAKLAPDPILSLAAQLRANPSADAINVAIGAYCDESGQPHEFAAVADARHHLEHIDAHADHQYLPMHGLDAFNRAATRLIYGPTLDCARIAVVQTASGTAALSLALLFARRVLNIASVAVAHPTWANHTPIIRHADMHIQSCAYYDRRYNKIDMPAFLRDLAAVKRGSLVLLHPCAHNPTGADLTMQQWHLVADVMQSRKLIPLFDMAYQGFASGDVDKDVESLRMFVARGFHVIVAQSLSKNLGLYNSRIGTMSVVVPEHDITIRDNIFSQLVSLLRTTVGPPCAYGARIAEAVLTHPQRREQWEQELVHVVQRMQRMRIRLREALQDMQVAGNWQHITSAKGMFAYLGLTNSQVERLRQVHQVYMTADSRVNVGGLTEANVGQLAIRIAEVIAFESFDK